MRRVLLGGLAIVLATLAVQIAGAGTAFARGLAVAGSATCSADGTARVTWTISNSHDGPETVTATTADASPALLAPATLTIPGHASATVIESGAPAALASISVTRRPGTQATTSSPLRGTVAPNPTCQPDHVGVPPTGADGSCVSGAPTTPSITIPDDDRVVYRLDGADRRAGTYPVAPGPHTVALTASAGTLTGRTHYSFELSTPARCAGTVEPVLPVVVPSVCTPGTATPTAPTLTLASTPGISYSVSPSGPFVGGQRVTVTATATAGHEFGTAAVTGWQYVDADHETARITFPAAPTCSSAVTPIPPTFVDDRCRNDQATGPTYTIPFIAGVTYVVDDVVASPGTYAGTDGAAIVVRADAVPGYTLTGPTTFRHVFPVTPTCTTSVTAAAPAFSDGGCSGTNTAMPATFTIDATRGVRYFVGEVEVAPGSHRAEPGSTVTVVARPDAGYVLVGTTTWSHHVAAAKLCDPIVVPSPALFADDVCAGAPGAAALTGATFTVPTRDGVRYTVNGVVVGAGTYPARDGSTLTVVAAADPGFTLQGVVQWTHTFTARPVSCHAVTRTSGVGRGGSPVTGTPTGSAPVTATPVASTPATSNPVTGSAPAETGVAVQEQLLVALALLVAGAACCAVATGGRRARQGP